MKQTSDNIMIFDEDNLRNVAISEIRTCISNLKGKIDDAHLAISSISEEDWAGSSKDSLMSSISTVKGNAISQASALEDIIAGIDIAISDYNGWEKSVNDGLDGQTNDICLIHLIPKVNGVCPNCENPTPTQTSSPPLDPKEAAKQSLNNIMDEINKGTPNGNLWAIILSTVPNWNNSISAAGSGINANKLVYNELSGGMLSNKEDGQPLISIKDAAKNEALVNNAISGLTVNANSLDFRTVTTGPEGVLYQFDGTVVEGAGKTYNAIRVEINGNTSYIAYAEDEGGNLILVGALHGGAN